MAKDKVIDLKTKYQEEIAPKVQEALKIKNTMSIPKVTKVVLNVGLGPFIQKGNKDYSFIVDNLTAITGQKPTLRIAKKAISNFKIREDDVIGVSVTLRGKNMYNFLDKLINVVFPRVRDFRGISYKSFDGNGNFSVGFKEHVVFPEISPDDVLKIHGLQVNISTTAKDNESGLTLLKEMGFPFQKQPTTNS
jgi:large subunit ribosomal protein L5